MESLWVPPTCGSNSFRINDEPALTMSPFSTSRLASSVLVLAVLSGSLLSACSGGPEPSGAPSEQPPSPTSAPALVPGGSPTGVPAQESVPDSRFGPGVYAFSLPSAQGPEVSLSQYLEDRHVVLVFYRAWW